MQSEHHYAGPAPTLTPVQGPADGRDQVSIYHLYSVRRLRRTHGTKPHLLLCAVLQH